MFGKGSLRMGKLEQSDKSCMGKGRAGCESGDTESEKGGESESGENESKKGGVKREGVERVEVGK